MVDPAAPIGDPLPQLVDAAMASSDRFALWRSIADATGVRRMAEIGVQGGMFAASILEGCPSIEAYYLVDPWRHLDDWNKPANVDDGAHEAQFRLACDRTRPFAHKCTFLRGTTTEVSDRLPDAGLDLVYVDGDHTLRGIVIDLVRTWPKVRLGGLVGGDDFVGSIFQHGAGFEPTMVFPLAVHFAEAVGAEIVALPFDQFLIHKAGTGRFRYRDLTGTHSDTSMASQLANARGTRAGPLGRLLGRFAR
jgi:hypothetical protein